MSYLVIRRHYGGQRTLHSDRDCPRVKSSDAGTREPTPPEVEQFDVCEWCSGEIDNSGPHGPRLSDRLLDLEPDAVGKGRSP